VQSFSLQTANHLQPENRHVKLNIDVKVQNDPARLFPLIHAIISSHDNWELLLAPRLILGLWHPRFLYYAKSIIPYCCRSYIGNSPMLAKKYFWDSCDVFSMEFGSLTTNGGKKFRKECQSAGKLIMVWTVNDPNCMMEAVRWNVKGILTDKTQTWLDLRSALQNDYKKKSAEYTRMFLWTTHSYYSPFQSYISRNYQLYLESVVGSFDDVPADTLAAAPRAVATKA